eukprot:284818102_4
MNAMHDAQQYVSYPEGRSNPGHQNLSRGALRPPPAYTEQIIYCTDISTLRRSRNDLLSQCRMNELMDGAWCSRYRSTIERHDKCCNIRFLAYVAYVYDTKANPHSEKNTRRVTCWTPRGLYFSFSSWLPVVSYRGFKTIRIYAQQILVLQEVCSPEYNAKIHFQANLLTHANGELYQRMTWRGASLRLCDFTLSYLKQQKTRYTKSPSYFCLAILRRNQNSAKTSSA